MSTRKRPSIFSILDNLMQASNDAVSRLRKETRSEDSKAALDACKIILDRLQGLYESADLAARLGELEEKVNSQGGLTG